MREILFRGRRIDTGEWVCWNQFGEYAEPFVCEADMHSHVSECDVVLSTIGQFTGLTDKNGKRIWEGDVVRHEDGSTGYIIFLAQTMSYRLVLPETDIAIGHRGMGGGYNYAPMLEVIGTVYDKEA